MAQIATQPVYKAIRPVGERAFRRMLGAALVAGWALAAAGCSVSFPIESLVADPEVTGSITPREVSPLGPDLSAEDWRRARSALAVALDPQGNGSPARWDNPESGMAGVFTPVAAPFVKDDTVCRAFTASLSSRGGTGKRLHGSACRLAAGEWLIREVKPVRSADA